MMAIPKGQRESSSIKKNPLTNEKGAVIIIKRPELARTIEELKQHGGYLKAAKEHIEKLIKRLETLT